ncbi:pancreatic triacylglycerol lipase-like [Schistocerca nitens]|uniref:pancreatic triacylglycerol lipase-like n=1 Tax=Schistocerca nitens TaxID=7011 RepID=UPI002118726B|nr:pancreatic triacylglycerol lipase-like [Schistocerca nitens]XP_049802421.1 pancreatic triacylglycerol lipase-like [Schistocerca nitens]
MKPCGSLITMMLICTIKSVKGCARSRDFARTHDALSTNLVEDVVDSIPQAVDCLGLSATTNSLLRNFFRPQTNEKVNTRFYLYNRANKTPVEISADERLNNFSHRNGTIVIVHGFLSSSQEEWVQNMAEAFFDKEDVNVIAVDWTGSWQYWQAVANTRVAAAEIARLLLFLADEGKVTPERIHLVGHSLGAHICSFAASAFNRSGRGKIFRITGLDPAQPCYASMRDNDMRLDPSDANIVDVIHTNGKLYSLLGLGIPEPVGHIDFYPNGGMCQPGCVNGKAVGYKFPGILSFLLSAASDVTTQLQKVICSHGRSYKLFTDSIRFHNCSFWGRKWNSLSEREPLNLNTTCSLANCTEMGYLADIFPARGSFYVPTRETEPFCIYDRTADLAMASSIYALHNLTWNLRNISLDSEESFH